MSPLDRRWLEAAIVLGDVPDVGEAAGACAAELQAAGCLGLQEVPAEESRRAHLTAWFPVGTLAADIERALAAAGVPGARLLEVSEVADPGWVEQSARFLQPIDVGSRLTLLPREGQASPGRLAIRIDPGRAFGTGHHESTRLALLWLEDVMIEGASVLDVGTGSGILSAAAARLGAREVLGVDCDPEAVEVATENLQWLPERGVVRFAVADGCPPDAGPRDVVVANITSDVIARLLPDLVRAVMPRGALILAGLLSTDESELGPRLLQAGLEVAWKREGEWSAARARRR